MEWVNGIRLIRCPECPNMVKCSVNKNTGKIHGSCKVCNAEFTIKQETPTDKLIKVYKRK